MTSKGCFGSLFGLMLVLALFLLSAAGQCATRSKQSSSKKISVPEVVRARKIELLDSSNKPRVRLSADAFCGPSIELLDEQGRTRAEVYYALGTAGIMFMDQSGKCGLAARLSDRGGMPPELVIGEDYSHGCRVVLNNKRIVLKNGDVNYATFELKDDGKPSLTMWYPNGNSAASMELTKDGLPRILAWNKDGNACYPVILGGVAQQPTAPPLVPTPAPLVPSRPSVGSYVTGSGHWIDSVSGNGAIVTLEDDSTWEVSPLDRIDTALWLATTDITVADSHNPVYPYKLINKDDGETADAKLISN